MSLTVLGLRVRHDDVIKWKHFPCYWPFVRGIHRSLVVTLTKASFGVFFDLPERTVEQITRRRWFETSSHSLWRHCNVKQDRRWNADKPSAALDPYILTWLTTSPANHRPANFWFFFFLTLKWNCEKWCNLRSNWWAPTLNSKFPFSDSFKYK